MGSAQLSGIRLRSAVAIAVAFSALVFCISSPSVASMMEAEKADQTASGDGFDDSDDGREWPPELMRRERVVTAGTMVLVGIVAVGLTLIAVVMILGRRFRRVARQRPASPTVVDELWYLKSKKTPTSTNPQLNEGAGSNFDEPQTP